MVKQKVPRVSLGLPVFNGEKFLAESIDSLISQTFDDFEIIISDNASTDQTEEICRRYAEQDSRIRYHRSNVNRGAAWNFNNTFELASGEFFKWAAHDDLHEPEFLEKCVDVLNRDSTVVLCFTGTDYIDNEGNSLGEFKFPVDVSTASRRELFRFFATGGHIVSEIFGLIRTDALQDGPLIGGYVGSDLVLLGTLALRGRFHQIPELLFMHREHELRSAVVTGGSEGFTHWYDSSKSGRFAMPYWRRIVENTKSVARSSIGTREKLACLVEICRTANWNRGVLWQDIVQVVRR